MMTHPPPPLRNRSAMANNEFCNSRCAYRSGLQEVYKQKDFILRHTLWRYNDAGSEFRIIEPPHNTWAYKLLFVIVQ